MRWLVLMFAMCHAMCLCCMTSEICGTGVWGESSVKNPLTVRYITLWRHASRSHLTKKSISHYLWRTAHTYRDQDDSLQRSAQAAAIGHNAIGIAIRHTTDYGAPAAAHADMILSYYIIVLFSNSIHGTREIHTTLYRCDDADRCVRRACRLPPRECALPLHTTRVTNEGTHHSSTGTSLISHHHTIAALGHDTCAAPDKMRQSPDLSPWVSRAKSTFDSRHSTCMRPAGARDDINQSMSRDQQLQRENVHMQRPPRDFPSHNATR